MTFNPKSVLKLVAVNFAVLVALVAAGEIALRLFMPVGQFGATRTVRQTIPGLKPVVEYSEIAPFIRARSAEALAKPASTIRVLCVGGSTTQQTTQETGDTWCGILEQMLNEAFGNSGKRIETLSYGKGGETSIGTARRLPDLVETIEPDIVVTLLGINDMFINGGPGYTPRHAATVRGRWPKCWEYSHFCRLYKQVKDGLEAKAKLREGKAVEWHSAALPARRAAYKALPFVSRLERDPDPIDEFRDNVEWIVKFLQSEGIDAVVLGQPVLWKPDMTQDEENALWFGFNSEKGRVRPSGEWLQSEMTRYNDAQAKIARDAGIPFVGLDGEVPKTLDYFFDDCHFTDKGSRAVAEQLFPVVKERVAKLLAAR